MPFKLKALQGELGEVLEKIVRTKPLVLVEEEEDYQIWLEPDFLSIQSLNFNIYSGVCCVYSEETKDYEVNNSLYLFYDKDTGKPIYFETDSSVEACLSNYFHFVGMEKTLEEIEVLECTYQFDKGKFLEEKVISRSDVEIEGQIDI